jgi:hypothetical protein
VDRLFPSEPNPVRASAVLRFELASAGHVRLTIHDLQGREVARVVDGERPAGIQTAILEGRALPPGVYMARLESRGRAQAMRFVRLD